ncbi:MAG: 3-dehydroquinate synthase II [Candidatus Micrarchaeota archaeon]
MKEVWVDSKSISRAFNLHHRDERGKWTEVVLRTPKDISKLKEAQKAGAERAFVVCRNWEMLPPKTVVSLSKKMKLIAKVKNVDEAKELIDFPGKMIQGVLLSPTKTGDVRKLLRYLAGEDQIDFNQAVVNSVKRVGIGARSYIDACEMMDETEGMLVGCTANAFVFIQAEVNQGDPHIRPFRINTGAVSSYVLLSNNETKYLAELKLGDSVLIVDRKGKVRKAFVGRNRIEHRPMVLIEAKLGTGIVRAILQDSASVRVMTPKGSKSVSKLRKGDKLLVHTRGKRRSKGETPMEK